MRFYLLFFMIVLWSGCAGFSDSNKDSQADSALGLAAYEQQYDDTDQDAQKALMENQEQQREEQKRLLSRQITDPLA